MRIINFIIPAAILLSSSYAYGQYQKTEYEKALDMKNRITINHDDGTFEVFYINENITNPRSEKYYYWYQSRKIQKTQGGYSGKLLHGNYQKFSRNRQLLKQGSYKKGLPHGNWKFWHANQHLKKEEHWSNGSLTGKVHLYNENGAVLMEGKMKDAQWNGKVLVLDSAKNKYHWKFYDDGKEISRKEYIDQSIFRKTAKYFSSIWHSVFGKEQSPASPTSEIISEIEPN